MDLTIIPSEETPKESLSLKTLKPKTEVKNYEVEKAKLSENIREFDKKVEKAKTSSPYDYNSVSLNLEKINLKKIDNSYTPTAEQMIADPLYNILGKFLGVDMRHEWGMNYDKVKTIVDWAKMKSGSEKVEDLITFLSEASQFIPTFGMNHKKIDQFNLYATLQLQKGI